MPRGVYVRKLLPRRPLAERFWAKVDRRGPDECWPWLGTRSDDGYGAIKEGGRGKNRQAHCVAWELENGRPMPPGTQGCHSCDNPPCCNPAHIFPGTSAQNVADKVTKGRQARGPLHGEKIRGERHGNAKLTAEGVREIRQLAAAGTPRPEIARRFALHPDFSRVFFSASVSVSRSW